MSGGVSTLVLDTDDFPARERTEAAREIFGRNFLRVELEPFPGEAFSMSVRIRRRPDLALNVGSAHGLAIRSAAMRTDGSDAVMFRFALNDAFRSETRGREHLVEPGDCLVGAASDYTRSINTSGARYWVLSTTRRVFDIPGLDDRIGRIIPRESEALRLLKSYLAAHQDQVFSDGALGEAAMRHVHDLLGLALCDTRDSIARAAPGGLRAGRLAQLKADILRSLEHGEVGAEGLAARHGLSPRYVRKLFESEGVSLTEFVLEQRLLQARRRLLDRPHARISEVAYSVGFGDLSYFNRCFRRRWGVTPSELRRARDIV